MPTARRAVLSTQSSRHVCGGRTPVGTNENQSGISRRDLLKKGAVAGGIVWVAPVVLSDVAGAASTVGSPRNCLVRYAAKLDLVQTNGVVTQFPTGCGVPPSTGNSSCVDQTLTYQDPCTMITTELDGNTPIVYVPAELNGEPITYIAAFNKMGNGCEPADVVKLGDGSYKLTFDSTASNVQFLACT